MSKVLECKHLAKTFHVGDTQLDVLRDIHFSLAKGEQVAIMGSSGSGKSTLLHLLGGLDKPSSGEISMNGTPLSSLTEVGLGRLRNRTLGFVYQFHHLLPEFTALENVAMPLMIAGGDLEEAASRAEDILGRVGLAERLSHKPGKLSGGERQRAAVARALVTRPVCVLADEPTGNLDRHNATQVYQLMMELNAELGTSFLVATHDMAIAERMDRILQLEDGCLAGG